MATPIRKTTTEQETAGLDFPEAMRHVIAGEKVRRQEWRDGEYIYLHAERLHIWRHDDAGELKLHQVLISSGDMLATDWALFRAQ